MHVWYSPAGYSQGTPLSVNHQLLYTNMACCLGAYLESNAEEDIVQEEECHAGFCHFCLMSVAWQLVIPYHHRDDQVTETLACSSVHEHLPSTPALNVGNTDGREEQVAHAVDGSEQASHCVTEAHRFYKDRREII